MRLMLGPGDTARIADPIPPGGILAGMSTFKNYALAVVLVALAIAGLVVLNVAHVDTSTLESLVTVLVVPLLGLLIGKVQAVEKNTNGNTSALLQMIENLRKDNARQAELLARSLPVPPDPGLAPGTLGYGSSYDRQ